MEKISDIAKRRLQQHRLREVSQAALALFDASQFFHHHFTDEPDAAKPLKIQNSTLWIGVKHSIYSHEIHSISGKLLLELQGRYGKRFVQRIRTKDLTNA